MATATSRGLQFLRQSQKSTNYVCARCSLFSTYPTLQSGHNRWSKIKHDKAGVDAKKNAQRSLFARDIAQASRCEIHHFPAELMANHLPVYGPDPQTNPTLAHVLTVAKKGILKGLRSSVHTPNAYD
jgi:hypothetical protein